MGAAASAGSKVNAMIEKGGMSNFEVPAYLRKQAD
jgi:hypothetical protein